MRGINEFRPTRVYTNHGLVDMAHIMPTDYVYEWGTGRPLKVMDVVQPISNILYEVMYSDKRIQYISHDDDVFDGSGIIESETMRKNLTWMHPGVAKPIRTFQLDFNRDWVYTKPNPDPFVAGALLTYGDYDDPYLNLPFNSTAINEFFSQRYDLNYANLIGNNKVYFRRNGTLEDSIITWGEFFPHHSMYVVTKNFSDPLISREYVFASVEDRWHYIQGAFEIGFNRQTFPFTTSIAHWSEERLKVLQEIMWSLGILSRIVYDPNMEYVNHWKYRLDVIGKFEGYPGFHYNVENIEWAGAGDYLPIHDDRKFQLHIASMEPISGYIPNLRLEEPGRVYVGNLFLPRVSMS